MLLVVQGLPPPPFSASFVATRATRGRALSFTVAFAFPFAVAVSFALGSVTSTGLAAAFSSNTVLTRLHSQRLANAILHVQVPPSFFDLLWRVVILAPWNVTYSSRCITRPEAGSLSVVLGLARFRVALPLTFSSFGVALFTFLALFIRILRDLIWLLEISNISCELIM